MRGESRSRSQSAGRDPPIHAAGIAFRLQPPTPRMNSMPAVGPRSRGKRGFGRGLAPDVRHLDLALADRRVDGVLGAKLGIAVAAHAPDFGQLVRDLLVGGAAADE